MRPKEIMLNIRPINPADIDDAGDDHVASSYNTPLRPDAFELSDDEKVEKIEKHFREIMTILGLDLNDDSLSGTPKRVAKMYVKEVFSGLNPKNRPHARLFENKYKYDQMLVEKDITFYSHCEHHFVPIFGKAHVAYFSSGKVIGLSKINRIVQYFAKRPQVQERLTVQIAKELQRALHTDDVAVVLDATHLCVASRGVGDTNSKTGTAHFSGKFNDENIKREFLNYINTK
ncbi:MAG: GTP cyclohydrolase I FolE [Cyclobacteriaceae bacterium]|nr:GTP cyclohydrolase I FolE [Cyclobacteriaceae bacterium]UYN85495.1 MAG: GTP cyclohydrolase I FolE [Cyclobacteriaceae bacterium]